MYVVHPSPAPCPPPSARSCRLTTGARPRALVIEEDAAQGKLKTKKMYRAHSSASLCRRNSTNKDSESEFMKVRTPECM